MASNAEVGIVNTPNRHSVDQTKVWVSYNSPQYLQKRHALPQDLMQNIAVVEMLAAKAAE